MELEASNGQRVLAYLVFGHALRFFKDSCLRAINESLLGGAAITTEDVQWVITVPAIWRQSAKQFMRFAATEVITQSLEFAHFLNIKQTASTYKVTEYRSRSTGQSPIGSTKASVTYFKLSLSDHFLSSVPFLQPDVWP